jgi:hypothetical protein
MWRAWPEPLLLILRLGYAWAVTGIPLLELSALDVGVPAKLGHSRADGRCDRHDDPRRGACGPFEIVYGPMLLARRLTHEVDDEQASFSARSTLAGRCYFYTRSFYIAD